MSKIYSVTALLDASFTFENIQCLLKKGLENEFVYFDQIECERYFDSQVLNLHDATNKIFISTDQNREYGRTILTKYQDTSFSFRFINDENNRMQVDFSDISYRWIKEFWNSGRDISAIDFARYIRLLLKICEDFNIKELATEILD